MLGTVVEIVGQRGKPRAGSGPTRVGVTFCDFSLKGTRLTRPELQPDPAFAARLA